MSNLPAAPGIPSKMADLMPLRPGRTVIHRVMGDRAEEVYQLLALRFLDFRTEDSLPMLREMVLLEFPELEGELTDIALRHFIENYVEPAAALCMAPWMRRGLLRADADLNAVKSIAEVASRMEQRAIDVEPQVGKIHYDESGKPHPIGPTEADYNKMLARVAKTKQIQLEEMARLGMVPERKGASPTVNVNVGQQVNLDQATRGFMRDYAKFDSGAAPSAPPAPEPVDASFREGSEEPRR